MTMEQLHFMVESPANFVRLACTILFEKREAMAEWAATWHDVFDCANGEQLFLQFKRSVELGNNFSRMAAPLGKRS